MSAMYAMNSVTMNYCSNHPHEQQCLLDRLVFAQQMNFIIVQCEHRSQYFIRVLTVQRRW